jgi:transposase
VIFNERVLLPSSRFTKAANYALQRQEPLSVFLRDPNVSLDTNELERALRPIPMGRKNWLFCWTEVGARYAGIIQSLIQTCRMQGVDPYTYLVDVLQRIDTHPACQVHLLTPRLWKQNFSQNPISSDLFTACQ